MTVETTKSENTAAPASFVRRAAVFLFRWTYRLVGSLIVASALVVLFAQTNMARQLMREKILDIVNGQLKGKLMCDDVEIDIFRGVVLTNPQLYAHGSMVLGAERLEVAYDLAGLLGKTLAVNKVALIRPQIHVLRTADSVWNVDDIALPSADTTTTPPPNIAIRVRGLTLTEGRVVVNDATSERGASTAFDPMHLDLQSVELRASARLALRDEDYTISIDHLSFFDTFAPALDVRALRLSARVRPGDVDVRSLTVQLARTSVQARARVFGLNILRDGISDSLLARFPIRGRVEADEIWGEDLHFFIPDIDLRDAYKLRANAVFAGDRLLVSDIQLTAGDGNVRGNVEITGLSKGIIGLDIKVVNSSARFEDVRRRIAFVPLPDLPFLSRTHIDSVHLRGHPDDSLWFEVHGYDRPGRVDGTMKLYLRNPVLGYDVDMRVGNGDLSAFSDSSIATSLHGAVRCRGQGVALQELDGEYHIELQRSILIGRPIRRFSADVRAVTGGMITLDTLYADITPFSRDTIDHYALTSDDRVIQGKAVLNVSNPVEPRYNVDLHVNAVNLAQLLNNAALPSRCSGNIVVDAVGVELDSITGTIHTDIEEFSLNDRALLPFSLTASSERIGDKRVIRVQAPFMQATVHGLFNPSDLISAFALSIDHTVDAVRQRIRHLFKEQDQVEHLGRAVKKLQASFDIDVRDASPLNVFLDDISLSASAMVRGNIQTEEDSVNLRIDTLFVRDLFLRTPDVTIVSDPLSLSFATTLFDVSTSPRVDELSVRGRCDSTLVVNGLNIQRPRIFLTAALDTVQVRASSIVDGIDGGVSFSGKFFDDSTDVRIDSLRVVLDTARGLVWRTLQPAHASLRDARVRIANLVVQRAAAEIGYVNGRFTLDEFEDAHVRVEKFDLVDIPRFVNLQKGHPVRFLSGFVESADLRINGAWEKPHIEVSVDASGVGYNGENIGTLTAKFVHDNQDIAGELSIANPDLETKSKTLDVRVRHLPLNLALRGAEERFVNDRPIDIDLRATRLALAAVEPFLPAIERLRGVADGQITIQGTTPDRIDLGGNASFRNASFLTSSTNIIYNADGVMHLDGSTLHLDTIVVRNLDRDRKKGIAYANGTVKFDGLSVESMDFTVRSPGILVMNKSSQARSPKVFGDMIIATGGKDSRPIRFYGKLDSPVLEGDIHVLYADIIFPQERSTTRSRYTAFDYNRSSDTVRRYNSVLDASRKSPATPDSMHHNLHSNVADAIESVVKSTTASFVDILRYDLNIVLKGRTLMTMVFGTFEILIADLALDDQKVPLNFTGRFVNNSTNLRGRVRVKDGTSTYKFYKPFVASGTLDFTRGGMTDPTLDLKAVYKDRRTLADGRQEDFRVEVVITGSKQKPIAKWSVYRQDRKQEGDSAKITGDALMLILVGKTQDELTSSGQGNLVGEVNASMSALATSALGDLLSGIGGIVQSTQIDIGSDISQSRLTVSGQLWSDVSYRLTGQISDFAGNSTITVTIPFTVLSDADAMRYFMLDASRSVNTTGNVTRYQRLWEVKLGARLP